MRAFICFLSLFLSSMAYSGTNGGVISFSGSIIAPPCSVEFVVLEPFKVSEERINNCVPTKSVILEPVFRSSSLIKNEKFPNYTLIVEYK